MSLQTFRERVNLYIYDSKERNLRILRYTSFFVSVFVISVLVFYYGFPQTTERQEILLGVIKVSFVFYIFSYITRFLYTFEPKEFLKRTWFEGLLMLLLVIDGFSYFFLRTPLVINFFRILGFEDITPFYVLFIQLYVLVIVALDVGSATSRISKLNLTPPTIFILSFVALIISGCGLFMLPEMTTIEGSMPFFEALFTSVSASCVTGLIVVDTATYFTFKGHLIILILMQLGGLSIISFATFLVSFSGTTMGIKQQTMMQSFLSTDSLFSTKGLLNQIILMTLSIEFFGALMIYFLWNPVLTFQNIGDKIFFSIFHSVSAFNNAGFSLFTYGLFQNFVVDSYILHIVLIVLIFMGGLGYSSIRDLFSIHSLRKRFDQPWRKLQLTTQIALYSAITLVLIGTIVFYILEKNNTLDGKRLVESVITSLFQSVTARTAGFNTVDFSLVSAPMLIFFIMLMFIGGSSGSTAGGIKTSTFTLLILSAYSTLRGKRSLELSNHSISYELLNRAFLIFLFASGIIFSGVFILSISDPHIPILNLVFEEVSAFATVGLSTGITPTLSVTGKTVLMASMFIGRVGILTLAFSMSRKVISRNYKYPSAHIMVG
ncbi:MAG: ATPase [Bacteroidetes bacterium]|nr:ATPase [Bacteroidota bacterium]HET6242996.1 potassium transporter TrkG [Bacteroidia bacterium]